MRDSLHVDFADREAFRWVVQRLALIIRISAVVYELVLSCIMPDGFRTALALFSLVDWRVDVRVVRRLRSTRLVLIE